MEGLSCALCSLAYSPSDPNVPVLLLCGHTFHKNCISSNANNGNPVCPTCHFSFWTPVESLQANTIFLEYLSCLKSGANEVMCYHCNQKPAEFFCITCKGKLENRTTEIPLCTSCQSSSHKDHQSITKKEFVSKAQASLKSWQVETKDIQGKLENTSKILGESMEKLGECISATAKIIDKETEKLIEMVKKRREALLGDLEKVAQYRQMELFQGRNDVAVLLANVQVLGVDVASALEKGDNEVLEANDRLKVKMDTVKGISEKVIELKQLKDTVHLTSDFTITHHLKYAIEGFGELGGPPHPQITKCEGQHKSILVSWDQPPAPNFTILNFEMELAEWISSTSSKDYVPVYLGRPTDREHCIELSEKVEKKYSVRLRTVAKEGYSGWSETFVVKK